MKMKTALHASMFLLAVAARAQDPLQGVLAREIVGPHKAMEEAQAYCEARVAPIPAAATAEEWTATAARLRREVLDQVVFRGEAAAWRDAKTSVEWLDEIEGGPGYRIRKLRYEALPGLWIPALLYEPLRLEGKVPVVLNVNGHDTVGKAATYKQIRCINQAKRGMLALNVEWLGMGQLRVDGLHHSRMNLLDLCGTSGVSVFYLAMRRGLDLLLELEHADPARAAVMGLSGGGWQTIFLSSLDERVTLSNPVAGYSSFRTRARFLEDLGDSEQTPTDLGMIADYATLTAMRAPRPTLLTFNSKDNCCFASPHALQPLLDAALPVFRLYGKESNLRSHVNDDPGTHNFERDNREAVYRMLGDHFYPDAQDFDAKEIVSDAEVKTAQELNVPMPERQEDFITLATRLSQGLPHCSTPPQDQSGARDWQEAGRAKLRALLRWDEPAAPAMRETAASVDLGDGLIAGFRELKVGEWSVPAVEIARGTPESTALLIADDGRAGAAAVAEAGRLLGEGKRVVAIDPFYFGESKVEKRDYLFALLIAGVGKRPLGVQAGQVAAAARAFASRDGHPVTIHAVGPRTGVIALCATALEPAISGAELRGSMGSLKEVISLDLTAEKAPELMCLGLLEALDLPQIAALAAPKPISFLDVTPSGGPELKRWADWHQTMGGRLELR